MARGLLEATGTIELVMAARTFTVGAKDFGFQENKSHVVEAKVPRDAT